MDSSVSPLPQPSVASDTGRPSQKQQRRRRNNNSKKNDKKPPRSDPNLASSDASSSATKSKNKTNTKPKTHKKKSHKPQDPSKDYKYLQIKKLLKKFAPVTINGLPVRVISKQVEEENPEKAIDLYLLKFIESQRDQAMYISFLVVPSDPEFPFELDCLKISLCIPAAYPYKPELPSIYVLNDEVPRGYAANIELGFKEIATLAVLKQPGTLDLDLKLADGNGLLSQILTLDKYLETFLRMEKRKTIKFVKGKPKPKDSKEPTPSPTPTPSPIPKVEIVNPVYVDEKQRSQLIAQVTRKLKSQVKLFSKSNLHTKFKVFVPIFSADDVPESWSNQGRIEVILTIPAAYPSDSLKIEIPKEYLRKTGNFSSYEQNLITNFNKYQFRSTDIVTILNYLANNLGVFCMSPVEFNKYNSLVVRHTESISEIRPNANAIQIE